MKKVILLVGMFIAMVSCGKENEQVQPTEVKSQMVVYDTLYTIDNELGEAIMVIEEKIVFK
jgi:hypothetical protein